MSDLRDLPDLAREVRERVVTPPYDAVSRRVRARRLRGAAGAVAAAVLVVGGVAVWQDLATTAGPPIPQPAETEGPIPPTDESQWRAVVDGTDAHVFQASGSDDGSIAVVWRALEQPAPNWALVIRKADGTLHGIRLDDFVFLTPVPGGWVGLSTARGHFIGTDGSWTDLGEPGAPRRARPGDVFIRGGYGISRLYSPQDRTWSAVPVRNGDLVDGYVTPDGDLVTCGRSRGKVSVADPRRGNAPPSVPGTSCVMAGRDATVAVAGLGDAADGGIPLTGLLVMTESGDVVVPRLDDTVDDVVSLIVTAEGTTLVTDLDGDAVLVREDGSDIAYPDVKLGQAFVAGDSVYATPYLENKGPLLVSDDDGVTWQETPLPGMESSEE